MRPRAGLVVVSRTQISMPMLLLLMTGFLLRLLLTWIGLSFNIMLTCCGMFVLPDVCVADSCAV